MKVTRDGFVRVMCAGRHDFIGVTNRPLSRDELACVYEYATSHHDITAQRETTAHSTYLEFTGGSRLYLAGLEFGMYNMGTYLVYFATVKDSGKTMWYRKV